jgi:hypothetical protein
MTMPSRHSDSERERIARQARWLRRVALVLLAVAAGFTAAMLVGERFAAAAAGGFACVMALVAFELAAAAGGFLR